MSADIRIWPIEDDNNYNVLWDAWFLPDGAPKYIVMSEEIGLMNLPEIFMTIEKRWMEYPFWSLTTGPRPDGTNGPYIQGRIG